MEISTIIRPQSYDHINGHTYTTLVNINGFPLAVGGYNEKSHTNKAEIFDISANAWIEVADYPYHKL